MILGLIFSLTWSTTKELEILRSQYLAAALDKEQIEILDNSCNTIQLNDATSTGYCIMLHFLEAKNAFNPYRKLSEFSEGKRRLDSLISKNRLNIELRYMRHSIQDRAPGFLGYNDELVEDKNFMSTKLASISDSTTYQLIYNYLEYKIK